MKIYESHLLYILVWAGLWMVVLLVLFISFDCTYEKKKVMIFLLFMFPKTTFGGKGSALLVVVFFKKNFEGKGNAFLAFHAIQDQL